MSETVKLIIEIPTDFYEITKAKVAKNMTYALYATSIANGIPLDDVKAEIEASMYCDKDTRLVENANASGLKKALDIIEKYKGDSKDDV